MFPKSTCGKSSCAEEDIAEQILLGNERARTRDGKETQSWIKKTEGDYSRGKELIC